MPSTHIKAAYDGAIHDAQEALDCGMKEAAVMTFKASMVQAGIEAAKECGFPQEMLNADSKTMAKWSRLGRWNQG